MVNKQLLNPKSITVIGASNDSKKPGGNMLKNILAGGFAGNLYAVNPKEERVQGIKSFSEVMEIPQTDLAILAIPAKYCPETVKILAEEKNTKAFIIISAGFGEAGEQGKQCEQQIVSTVNSANGCLIGPNCIGVITENYKGVFTAPVPPFNPKGCDLISGSGATAVFIMEAGMALGVTFANVFSVGNAAQTGVEDILEYMDENFNAEKDPLIKLLYLETISNPQKLLKHASSLIKKGAKIAAIKAGSTAEGSRAATSHTGAIASSDMTVRALFHKAGIVYCSSREQLLSVAAIFNYKKLKGKNIAIITHAGGSAVMLADQLSKGGLKVPEISGPEAEKLKSFLYPGSSIANPIDFLATGTAEQLGIIIDYCEHKFDSIDAMVVVFGSAGLFDVENVYNVLSVKLEICNKPIFPVLPSVVNAQREIQSFLKKGHIHFPDEVVLGKALAQVYNTPEPQSQKISLPKIDIESIRKIINTATEGYLSPKQTVDLLDAAGIPRVHEIVENSKEKLLAAMEATDFPVVMKVVGPLHKSDAQGVVLNIANKGEAAETFDLLMKIDSATAVMVQPQLVGLELFVGVMKEPGFNHTILCGLGGIFIEVLNDVSAGLSPISKNEAENMVQSLRGYKLIQGARGKKGANEKIFIDIIQRLSALVQAATEIIEMDINPLIGTQRAITAVDARVRIGR
ncbi:acetate--CoA ligase family protein [Aequorivita marisscotiae]|uniref:Acetate--CoA ligase family protein n=1 Tax=Aequorivita marisscotiae TaxID=3040348 RepID=A0ABY8KSU9_9FLAO|nr:acetate--CoA ligase family protein [Aequorivita sp. Ant34-E75]WGF91629.1 acetate--CoA ligase family protein [Aequorivita sp. Ant34-E75]